MSKAGTTFLPCPECSRPLTQRGLKYAVYDLGHMIEHGTPGG